MEWNTRKAAPQLDVVVSRFLRKDLTKDGAVELDLLLRNFLWWICSHLISILHLRICLLDLFLGINQLLALVKSNNEVPNLEVIL